VKRAAIGVFFVPIALTAQQTGDAWANIGPTPAAAEGRPGVDRPVQSLELAVEPGRRRFQVNSRAEAAYAGVQACAKFWWFSSRRVLEVRAGADVWRVKASRASAWYATRFHGVGDQRGR
jgi:hypothetical protein